MKTPHAEVPPRATEGVVKYACELVTPACAIDDDTHRLLEAWRTVLSRLGLVGQTAERYDGFGFGNLSVRSTAGFWITGTQTGHLEKLPKDHYAEVVGAELDANRLHAAGKYIRRPRR